MKTTPKKFIYNKKPYNYNVVTFDSLTEAQNLLGSDLLNVINLGNAVYARAQVLGKNPFKPRRKKYQLDATKLDADTMERLKALGAVK